MNTEITKEEILEVISSKIIKNYEELIYTKIEEYLHGIINDGVKSLIIEKTDSILEGEIKEVLSREIEPVNQWGEKIGNKTTLRELVNQNASEFWTTYVDSNGKPTKYRGEPRYKFILKDELKNQFSKAIEQNLTGIVNEFKKALKDDSQKYVEAYIDKIIK